MLLVCVAALTGCGKSTPPRASVGGAVGAVAEASGASGVATKNTVRLGDSDPASDAAAVARAIYPGVTPASRPQAVVLVDERNWTASLAAASLASAPLGAPLLYSDGETLPHVSAATLEALHPGGAAAVGGAQVIRVGTSAAVPGGYRTYAVPSGEPAAVAAAIERIMSVARGAAPRQVIVTAADGPPALAMPAAGLSAESGAPILFVTATGVPAATAALLSSLHRPTIYAVGPSAISARALAALARLGRVVPIAVSPPSERDSPAANAIAVSRFADGSFGWGIHEAGHGLVFALASDPLAAPAAAALSAHGDYAPLLLLESSTSIPPTLSGYLGDVQPGYNASAPPVRGFYNHGWLIGSSISVVVQAEIDSLLEISPSKTPGKATVEEEPSASLAE
ncbi:MAG TPA: hypothetical protein VGL68_00615 [Solirubrobacteraceae bacterium]